MGNETSITLIDNVSDWVVSQALTDIDLEQLVKGTCERLSAAGVPITRVSLNFSILHPLYSAKGFQWRRNGGITTDQYRHGQAEGGDSVFRASPYFHLVDNNLDHLRRRLKSVNDQDFPILKELYEEGITDYLAFYRSFADTPGRGMFGSWATNQNGGFSETDIIALLRIQKRLAVTAKVAVLKNLAHNAITTYLGNDAGNRVMDGQIRRGDGETIRAAIVMGDIRHSTQMAEELGRQGYIDALNTFFDNVASPFSEAGGEILSFIGDGFLAIFPCGKNTKQERVSACRKANAAAFVATTQMRAANVERQEKGLVPIEYGLGMHIGNVMYGNVGLADRLTFSAFGSAVNEAARLEALTKAFDSHIIASDEFASRCKGKWRSFGHQKLRGLEQSVEVFGPEIGECDKTICTGSKTMQQKPLSDAENVVLLQQAKSA